MKKDLIQNGLPGKTDPILILQQMCIRDRCMRQGPIVEELAEEGYNVGKIDVDQEMGLAQQFRVVSIPTLLIFKDGKEVHRLVGLTAKEDIKKILDE